MLSDENLHSILIAPSDWENDQISITVLTHAEKKGMSVLRDQATDQEFRRILDLRTANRPERRLHGVSVFSCAAVRGLSATETSPERYVGDRQYCVLDTDIQDLPHHADIFATMPRTTNANSSPKAVWRRQRAKLLTTMMERVETPPAFRGGLFAADNVQ